MSDTANSTRHVTYDQVKTIIDFMGQHVDLATGSLRTLEARHTSKRLWEELTKILNGCRGGTRKNSDGWSKVAHSHYLVDSNYLVERLLSFALI